LTNHRGEAAQSDLSTETVSENSREQRGPWQLSAAIVTFKSVLFKIGELCGRDLVIAQRIWMARDWAQ